MTLNFNKKYLIIAGIVILVIGAAIPAVYFYREYQKTQALLSNPAEAAKKSNDDVIAAVAKLVDVPADTDITVASVSDVAKLAGQPFFARAQNGDRVVYYPSIKKAILYRPETGKIIEMSGVSTGSASAQVAGATDIAQTPPENPVPTATPTAAKTYNLAIYNGTETPKLANNLEIFLAGKIKEAKVVKKENAAKSDYSQTIVIDLTGAFTAEATTLAGLIGASVKTLPAGETKPAADLLVIIGKNYQPK